MAILKLGMAASFCGKPYKWARTITNTSASSSPPPITTTTCAATTTFFISPHSYSLSLSLNRNASDWRRIEPRARVSSIRHCCYYHDVGNSKLLGFAFRGHKRFFNFSRDSTSSSSPPPSSKDPKTGEAFSGSDSSPSGSGLIVDMGSENKVEDVDSYQNNDLNCHYKSPSDSVESHPKQQDSYSKLLTLPTLLTLGRVLAVPLLISTFYVDSWLGRTATTSIFIAAAVTDWLDGYLARKMRLGSAFGAFLDPVADKLMVAAILVLLCTKPPEVAIFGQVPWLLTVPSIGIIGREITMSAVREWAASQNGKLLEAVAVNNLGKWKTATQMTALTILLAIREHSLGGPGIFAASGVVLLYISAGLSVWSLVVYMSKIWRVLLR